MTRFEIIIKSGLHELANVRGEEVTDSSISVDDLKKVIEVEQFLERLLGRRVHINRIL